MWLGRERVRRIETMHVFWIEGWEVCTVAWN